MLFIEQNIFLTIYAIDLVGKLPIFLNYFHNIIDTKFIDRLPQLILLRILQTCI